MRNNYTVSIVRHCKLETGKIEMEKFTFDNKRWTQDCRNACMLKGFSYRDLENGVGKSYSTIHRILTDKREPMMSEFILLCAVLDLEAITYFDVDEVQLRMF